MSQLSNCGCAETASTTVDTAHLSNAQYLTLTRVPVAKLLGIVAGAQQQVFLGDTFGGFAYSPDGVSFHIEKAPALTLPIQNAKVGSAYPLPTPFRFLMGGDAEANTPWRFIAAPSTGDYFLRVRNGRYELAEAEELPGIGTIAAQDVYVNQGDLLAPYTPDDDGPVTLRKLLVVNDAVIVGTVPDSGAPYYAPIGQDAFLKHSRIQALEFFHVQRYEQLIPGASTPTVEADGIPLTVQEITDDFPVVYSTGGKRFLRRKNRTIRSVLGVVVTVVPDNNTWQPMGTHCQMPSTDLASKAFYVSATIRMSMALASGHESDTPNYNMDFGLFVDNVLKYTWDVKGAKDNTLTNLVQGISIGAHDVEIRVRKTNVAFQTLSVVNSNMELFSL